MKCFELCNHSYSSSGALLVAEIKRICILEFWVVLLAPKYYRILFNSCFITHNLCYQVRGRISSVPGPTRAHYGLEVFLTMTLNGTTDQRDCGPHL